MQAGKRALYPIGEILHHPTAGAPAFAQHSTAGGREPGSSWGGQVSRLPSETAKGDSHDPNSRAFSQIVWEKCSASILRLGQTRSQILCTLRGQRDKRQTPLCVCLMKELTINYLHVFMLIYYVTLRLWSEILSKTTVCLQPHFHISRPLSLQHTVLFAISLIYHGFVHMSLSFLKYSSILISVFSIFTFLERTSQNFLDKSSYFS